MSWNLESVCPNTSGSNANGRRWLSFSCPWSQSWTSTLIYQKLLLSETKLSGLIYPRSSFRSSCLGLGTQQSLPALKLWCYSVVWLTFHTVLCSHMKKCWKRLGVWCSAMISTTDFKKISTSYTYQSWSHIPPHNIGFRSLSSMPKY